MVSFPEYKTVRVSDLIPYARNSRTHSEAQVAKIAASIKEFGFLNPVIIDGKNGIIAGHGRVMAAQKIGITEVPAVEASHLTDAQRSNTYTKSYKPSLKKPACVSGGLNNASNSRYTTC